MRSILAILGGLALAAVVAAYFLAGRPAETAHLDAPFATPHGITLHNTVEQRPVPYNLLNIVKGAYRFGDAMGMTAYTTDADTVPGKSTCEGDCATAWPPVAAPAEAKAEGDWTIVLRPDGVRQWAYRGKPLYTSTKDKNWGQLKGDRTDGVWHVAVPVWNNGAPVPPEIAVHEVAEALGQSLVDDRGMALYTGPAIGSGSTAEACATPCAHKFRPYEAPQIALPLGDFTTVDRVDGVRQWVYKGFPLYTYDGDVRLGDANGSDKRFNIALVARYFVPKQAVLRPDEKMGGIWTTGAGKSLYIRDLLHYTASGAHSARGGDPGLPQLGRTVGLMGCDTACEETHPPLIAPAGSEPSGYWTIYDRPDGRRQWAYAGYALYSSTADTNPGDLRENDDYDVLRVETAALRTALDPFGPGLFWHAANP
jgi:predicted lipoprotein with Yx(FWY)xxD motif